MTSGPSTLPLARSSASKTSSGHDRANVYGAIIWSGAVRNHRQNIYRKLRVNRAGVMAGSRGLACSARFLAEFEKLARLSGWEPGQKGRGAKTHVVDALSHKYCLSERQIYDILKSLELTAACEIVASHNNGEAIHPTLVMEATRAEQRLAAAGSGRG